MNRLHQLYTLRDRVDTEIAAEKARILSIQRLAGQIDTATTYPAPGWLPDLLTAAAEQWGVTVDDITNGPGRGSEDAQAARWCVMWAARTTGMSYPRIGLLVNRDHTTVMYGLRKVERTDTLKAAAVKLRGKFPKEID